MWNPSYLLATLDQLTNYLEIVDAAFVESDGAFECVLKNQQNKTTVRIPAQWFIDNMAFDWSELINRCGAYKLLTGFNKELDTLERAACFIYVQRMVLEHGIDHADVWKDEDKWCINYRTNNKSTVAYYSSTAYSSVVAAECLLRGYVVKEYMGSHYTVTTPNGLEHITSSYTCSCHEHQTRKICAHTHLIKDYLKYRYELIKVEVAKIIIK